MTIRNVTFDVGDSMAYYLYDDTALDADRMRVGGESHIEGTGLAVSITNSVFDYIVDIEPRDSEVTTSRIVFAFNTVVVDSTLAFYTQTAAGPDYDFTAQIENNIIVASRPGAVTAIMCPRDCTITNNIIYPHMAPVPVTNLAVDPKFVDLAGRDYHLQADSPAVGAAMSSPGLSTDHDFDGVMRPQGAAPDLGAFEH